MQGPDKSSSYVIDEKKSTEDNINDFVQYLKTVDAEMGSILEERVNMLFPFPESGPARTKVRQEFNKKVIENLKAIKEKTHSLLDIFE